MFMLGTFRLQTCDFLWDHWFHPCMLLFLLFLCSVLLLFFLSSSLIVPFIRLRAPLLFCISHLLSHLDYNLFSIFKLDTNHLLHMMLCNVASRTLSLDPSDSLFPHFSFSVRVGNPTSAQAGGYRSLLRCIAPLLPDLGKRWQRPGHTGRMIPKPCDLAKG